MLLRRGKFKSPKTTVEKWLTADIEPSRSPDIVLDVSQMDAIESSSIDVVNALELFEHVSTPEKGLEECYRILKPGGHLLLSQPFLYPIHADPYDYQRWTAKKFQELAPQIGFTVEKLTPMGGLTSVLSDLCKLYCYQLPKPLRFVSFTLFPALNLVALLRGRVETFPSGYFIILRK